MEINHEHAAEYVSTGEELTRRIKALIPDNPDIMRMSNPFDLLGVPGFEHSDLGPSYFQVCWSLARAKTEYMKEQNDG